jgi:hypothetical protein
MTKLITRFSNNFHTIITIVSGLIIAYIVMYPYYLQFYFENTLGRVALLSFIIAITLCNPIIGTLATVAFIGLYNSRVIEGLETMDIAKKIEIVTDAIANKKATEPKTTEASTPGVSPAPVSAPPSEDKKVSKPLDKTAEPSDVPKEPVTASSVKAQLQQKMEDKKMEMKEKKEMKEMKEGFNNRLTYADLDEGRNRMLTIESYIRKPKCSNQMPISKYNESRFEPMANYSGIEGLQSVPAAH